MLVKTATRGSAVVSRVESSIASVDVFISPFLSRALLDNQYMFLFNVKSIDFCQNLTTLYNIYKSPNDTTVWLLPPNILPYPSNYHNAPRCKHGPDLHRHKPL